MARDASSPQPIDVTLDAEVRRGRRDRNLYVAITVLVLVAGLLYLAVSGLGSGSRWDLTVSQAAARIGEFKAADVRVRGKLVDDSLARMPGEKFGVTFAMFTEGDRIHVDYYDKAPDPLVNGAEVTVEGKFKDDGRFLATRVFAKCPSKYEGKGKPGPGYGGKRTGAGYPGSGFPGAGAR
ncbi:MAG: cytochrome c maturation protein CcmE [Deltaproteobacteria bacterium]|nr:cytochrome c maturation protein CcmE [Deltaproteobacteria bacterium]